MVKKNKKTVFVLVKRSNSVKILFFGDSITDMGRYREEEAKIRPYGLGAGHVFLIATKLMGEEYGKYTIVNRGNSGDRVVDLYARIKHDVWNEQPDVLSILIGANDVWKDLSKNSCHDGVDIVRWEKVYRMIIEDTKINLPNAEIMICEPFVLPGTVTREDGRLEAFNQIRKYAKVARKLAKEYNLSFVALQDKLDEMAEKYGEKYFLYDGIHPDIAGINLIAKEWLKIFKTQVENLL